MSSPENFVSRWARLKSESDTEPKTESAAHEAVVSVGIETPSALQHDKLPDEPFDPASLPSIEMITFDTDIRGFLQDRVPAALTRAALRQAWASDPAIRDFVGIAENQWDFNDPTAMPGFGPMLETDKLPSLLARALGGHDKLADIIPEIPTVVENALQVGTGSAPTEPDRSLQQIPERSPSSVGICDLLDEGQESTATGNKRSEEEGGSSQSHRSHGSALPR
jgi:hypothetical protein